ncbi:hypothetical protein SSA02_09030 [Swaminathania salitolerans]|uniref:DUF2946 domain-containing protein n=1 Tax=Swaminathania salitolerans TaxID=182838 RepID=A0A511BN13_9PROT|nr:hypothetical protein SSA02_09030 [Swaminathania salitolerans]
MRLPIVLLMLSALLGTLALQSLASYDETPRAEIERLTGIDIAAALVQAPHSGCDDMSGMIAPGRDHYRHKGTHHHDEGCALCPLFQFAAFFLALFVFAAFIRVLRYRCRHAMPPARAPPVCRWAMPPSQAPPFLLKPLACF